MNVLVLLVELQIAIETNEWREETAQNKDKTFFLMWMGIYLFTEFHTIPTQLQDSIEAFLVK